MKTVTLNVEGLGWINAYYKNKLNNLPLSYIKKVESLLLELNLMKKAWKPYGVKVDLKTHSLNRIIEQGTSNGETIRKNRRSRK